MAKKKTKKKVNKKSKPAKKATKKATKKTAKKTSKKVAKKVKKTSSPKKTKVATVVKVATLNVGDTAPGFSLQDQHGNTISLNDLAGKPVVLYFYPKDMTPGCTQEACDFRDSFARLNGINATVLGVSKDSVELHKKFAEKYGLNFSLLADTQGQACEDYGVWQEKSLYGKNFMGIVRTTFLIGPDQKIKKIYPKVKVEGHVSEILEDLKGI